MDIPIFLVEPKGNENRRCIGELIARKKGERLNLEKIRTELKERRRYCLDKLEILSTELEKSLKRYPRLKVLRAKEAKEAINFILEISQDIKDIAVNKSATIDVELRDELVQKGFRIIDTYYEEFPPFSQRIGHYFELPHLPYEVLEGSFKEYSPLKGLSNKGSAKNLLGLLGVSSISAEDGSIFFFQHFSNISKIFLQARKIILIAGIEKIAKDREDAAFQTKCMGMFGLESILLNLSKKVERRGLDLLPPSDSKEKNLYLILLEGGRKKLRENKFRELFLCISCRACIRKCPIYQFSKGEKGLSPKDYLFSFLLGKDVSLNFCLHCQSCGNECPIGIDLSRLIMEAKSKKGTSFSDKLLGHIELWGKIGGLNKPISNNLLRNYPLRKFLAKRLGISEDRRLPEFATPTFKGHLKVIRSKEKVAYFAGCFARYFDPLIGKAVLEVLGENGLEVSLPEQRCCGLIMMAEGNIKGALGRARYNVESLSRAVAMGYDIVVSCPTCGLSLREEYPKLLATEASRLVSQRTYEISQYLMRLHHKGRLSLNFRKISFSILYHNPCHLKVQGINEAPELMSLVPGLSLGRLEKGCCGMGGIFGLKSKNYSLSVKIGKELFEEIKLAQVDRVITECGGCKLQIEEGSGIKVIHPVILLYNAIS